MLRWIIPIMPFRRTTLRDTELDGQRIEAGDKVVLYYSRLASRAPEGGFAGADAVGELLERMQASGAR